MKPLYWTKVQRLPGTTSLLWDELEDVDVPPEKLEELFTKALPKPKAEAKVEEGAEAKPKKPGKEAPTKVIDPKKGQNVGIFMKSNKLTVSAVEDIVYRFNYSGDLETLVTLRTNQATEEELAALQGHVETSPDKRLDQPDQFLLDISKIQALDLRLACLQFKIGFGDRVAEVETRMANIRSCCAALATGPALRKVLGTILSCGNYLNGGNKQRGQAEGFCLDILPKLKDLKATSNTDNLLAFVVKYCIMQFDEQRGTAQALLPVPEPGDLDKCRNVDFEVEKAACAALLREVEETKRRVTEITGKAAEAVKEPFHGLMTKFLESADKQAKEITAQVDDCANKFVECMKKFNFRPKKGRVEEAKPEEFFDPWHLFADDYKDVWKREQVRFAHFSV
jgi:hypothetical protein